MIAITVGLMVIVVEGLIGLFMLGRMIRRLGDIKEAVWSINTMIREKRAYVFLPVGNEEKPRAINVGNGPVVDVSLEGKISK